MNEKRKWITAGRFRRGAAILGALGLTAGAGLLMAGSALAAVGTEPGDLALSPTTGLLTSVPTWSTTVACPATANISAQVDEYSLSGTLLSSVSGNQTANLTNPTGFTGSGTGTLLGSIGGLLNTAGINASNPGTVEWVVDCWSGAGESGTEVHAMSLYVTLPASAPTTYTTSASAPTQTATNTVLTVNPTSGVTTTTPVTLSATVTASDGTAPAGNVTFNNGTSVIATVPVTWSGSTGTAVLPSPGTTTFSTAGSFPLSATFNPTSQTYASSTSGTTTLTVTLAGSLNAGGANPVVINATVAATGTLTVTVAPGPVNLTVTGLVGTGSLPNVSIKDTRNNFPGWSVMGQESAFTSSATPSTPIPGSQLGWAPAAATGSAAFDGTHVVLGPAVTAGTSPGLSTSGGAELALAHAGFGADPSGATTYIATAALTLDIPPTTTAGAYTGNLTVTYLSAQA